MSGNRRFKPHEAPPFAVLHRPNANNVKTLELAGVRQSKNYSCGYATALMVSRFLGNDSNGKELFEHLGTDRYGTSQSALIRTLRQQGVRANIRYDVNFDRIKRAIDAEKPLIAYLDDDEHWLVIYGYGLNSRRIFVADPRPGYSCEREWSTYGKRLMNFGIVCSAAIQGKDETPTTWVDGPEQLSLNLSQ